MNTYRVTIITARGERVVWTMKADSKNEAYFNAANVFPDADTITVVRGY